MLSYQHAYHAGGPADLHKHIVLAGLIARLTQKPRPITYAETHAGRGLYDLGAPEALKTGEAAAGIGRIAIDPGTPFGRALSTVRRDHGPTAYPGSPLIARALLRPGDRSLLFDLHPAEHAALRRAAAAPGTTIARQDGFAGLLALAPPKPRQGLVLVDPSYEVKTEYAATAAFVRKLVARWPEAWVLVWYPLLPAGRHGALREGLAPLSHHLDEVLFDPAPARGMSGSGLLLVNGPHDTPRLFEAAREAAPMLVAHPAR